MSSRRKILKILEEPNSDSSGDTKTKNAREKYLTQNREMRGGGGGVLKKTNGDFANHQNQKLNITYEHKKADNEISHNQKVLYSLLEK